MPKLPKRSYREHNYPRYADSKLGNNASDGKAHLRIVSFNIKYGQKIPQAIDLFTHDEHLSKADLICLQEMNPPAVTHLATALRYNYVYYPAAYHFRPRQDLGNAILSRWPILDDKKIILPYFDPTKPQRIAVEAIIEVGNKKVSICSLHLSVYSTRPHRRKQIRTITTQLNLDGDIAVVAGDFNSFAQKHFLEIEKTFAEVGFQHASANIPWTYKHWYLFNKTSTLDHIFAKNCEVLDSGMVDDHSASDHVPIWADIAFKQNETT